VAEIPPITLWAKFHNRQRYVICAIYCWIEYLLQIVCSLNPILFVPKKVGEGKVPDLESQKEPLVIIANPG
jgi:hypothetical protein